MYLRNSPNFSRYVILFSLRAFTFKTTHISIDLSNSHLIKCAFIGVILRDCTKCVSTRSKSAFCFEIYASMQCAKNTPETTISGNYTSLDSPLANYISAQRQPATNRLMTRDEFHLSANIKRFLLHFHRSQSPTSWSRGKIRTTRLITNRIWIERT